MRPPHLILLFMCFVGLPVVLTFFSLLHTHPSSEIETESPSTVSQGGIWAFFSFHTPSTLFPSSAIISLTDDNSTFFLARPADFGSLLPSDGLSGQLWVGSGFGDDSLGRAGGTTGAEGELGCSDVPGWAGGSKGRPADNSGDNSGRRQSDVNADGYSRDAEDSVGKQRRSDVSGADTSSEAQDPSGLPSDDGTDDHLHHPLPGSLVSKPSEPGQPAQHEPARAGRSSGHADIQSLQESAEIAGKVVLLSRGGCGFLEKVKWAQRRGGTALIVGDNTPGGPLVTMYARGDTSNITIPSLFTSHTTAHLLASLIPPGGNAEDSDGLLPNLHFKQKPKKPTRKKGSWKQKSSNSMPTFTAETDLPASTFTPVPNTYSTKQHGTSRFVLGGRSHVSGLPEDSRRPPSSGSMAWFGEKWADDEPLEQKSSSKPRKEAPKDIKSKETNKKAAQSSSSDDFVIGVQDWRDPDLVGIPTSQGTSTSTSAITKPSRPPGKKTAGSKEKDGKALAGGSITPGSGEYGNPGHRYDGSQVLQDQSREVNHKGGTPKSWFRRWFAGGADHAESQLYHTPGDNSAREPQGRTLASHKIEDLSIKEALEDLLDFEEHDGLWVTLTPTTMSTSPFFDTLLVLVVSPLVTLTVVYALLLLRSRIRRRRWRAPKSVVERLPVRTYHTMSSSSTSSSSSFIASPKSSSPTSPLLHASPGSTTLLPRPRSRTTSGIGDAISPSLDKNFVKPPIPKHDRPKKPYSGRQVECVVCLEEYVDGQSRVMSLPCGHEFHAECM